MSESNVEVCPTCGVTIVNDVVKYAHGDPATRDDLAQRVCSLVPINRHEKRNGCINKDARGQVTEAGTNAWRKYNFDYAPKKSQ